MKVRSVKKKTANGKSVLSNAKIKHSAFFTSFYSSPVAKALLDINTNKYIEVNDNFLRLFECKISDVLNKTPEKLGFMLENAETKEVLKTYRKDRFRTFIFNIRSFKGNIKNVIITTEKITLLEKDYLLGHIIDNSAKAEFEKRLEDSEHKYSIVLNNTQNVIYEYNFTDDRYNYISPSANELLGITPETFLKKKNNIITPLLSLSDRRLFKDHFKMLKRSTGKARKNFYVEYRIKDKQKNEKWLSDSHTVIYNKSGSAESIIGNITDVSAKKGAQEELIQSYKQQEKYLEQLTAIQDSLPANIALIDKNGKILAVNNAWKSFASENGLSCLNYCVGTNYLTVCKSSRGKFAEGSKEVYDGMKKVLAGKLKEFQMEYPCHSKKEQRWFRFSIGRISSKINSGAVVMHVNITAQKLAEQSIKESEDQYKLLFYNNPLPMWIFDFDSLKFIAVNDAAIDHYGYSKDEFLKMKLTDIRPKTEVSKFLRYRRAITESQTQQNSNNTGIWKHKKKNGEIIDVEITKSPVVFEGRKAVLILANDVTENLSAEAALLKRNKEISELYRAANELSRTLDSHKIYNSIYRIIRKLMPCDSMLISSYDKRNNSISCKAAWIGRKRLDISGFPIIPADFNGGGLQSRIIKTGKSELLLNFQDSVKQTGNKFYYKPDGTINDKPNEKNRSERSAIVVPLKLKDAVTGVIQVKSLKDNAYTESDLMLVESLAAQISVSTSNAELYQQAQTEIRIRKETESQLLKTSLEISNIYEISKDLSDALTTEEINRKIFKKINATFPECDIGISIFDEAKGLIILRGLFTNGKEVDTTELPPIVYDTKGKGLQSSVILSRKTRLVENYKSYINKKNAKFYIKDDGTVTYEKYDITDIAESAVIVPLIYENRIIGTLQLLNYSTTGFTESTIKMLETLSSHIAVSFVNAELHMKVQNELNEKLAAEKALQAKTEELQILYDAQRVLSSSLEIDEIYNKIYDIVREVIPCDSMVISSFNKNNKIISCRAAWIKNKQLDASNFPEMPLDETKLGIQSRAIIERKSLIVDNIDDYVCNNKNIVYIHSDSSVTNALKNRDEINKAALVVPLILKDNVLGVIQIMSYKKGVYNSEHLRLLEAFSAQISAAAANSRLYEEAQSEIAEREKAENALKEKTHELQILYDAQQVLSGSLEIENIYDTTYKIISSKLTGDSMIISSYNEEEQKINIISVWTNGVKPDIKGLPPVPLAPEGRGIQSEVIRTGKSLLIENYKEHFRKTVTSYSNTDNVIHKTEDPLYNSAIIVPMKHDNKIIGVIQLLSYKEKAYNEANMKLLESLASSISAATFNASLYRLAKTEIAEKQKAREELALRNKEITLLYSAGRELLSTLNLEEIYEILYRKVIDIIPCDSMIISEYDKKRGEVFCKAAWVLNTKHDAKSFPRLKIGTNYKGTQVEAIVTGSSLIVNDFYEVIKDRKDKYYFDDEGNVKNYENPESMINHEDPVVRSAMYIPMKIGRNVIGVISVFSYKDNAYSEYDLKILESISVHLSVAAANAELYKRAQSEIAEKIKKEEELKQIRKNLENAQRIAHIGSWVFDKRVNKIFNSSELYRILGIENEPESFEFDEGMSHIHTEDRDGTRSKLSKAIEEKASYQNEDRIIRPNGEIRFVKIVGEPMYDEKGVFIGMQGTLQDITEIKRINDELLKSLNEKELILKEIHHRVKNNLQIVSSLLRLQAESIEDKAAIGYLKMSEQRVKSMALIHQQLYRTKDLSRIDFREYIEDLCNYLFFAYDISFSRVSLQIEVDEIYFGIDTALPCGLIINELVTNAIKHAFPDYSVGSLTVKLLRMATGKYSLTVKDDGKGANKVDFEKTSTLGMELVKTLTEQLEGEIKVDVESGTEITISFFDQNKE